MCSHSFYSVEAGINDSLYIRLNGLDYIVKLTAANYNGTTFAAHLQTKLHTISAIFAVVFNINQNNITITCTNPNVFQICTDKDLSTFVNNTWTGSTYTPTTPFSCNDILNSTLSNSPPQHHYIHLVR